MLEIIFSNAIVLLFLLNSVGVIPFLREILSPFEKQKHKYIITREVFFSLLILLFFGVTGKYILNFLGITRAVTGIAGGILLLVLALNLIFPKIEHAKKLPTSEPFIVPIAIPSIAGPASIVGTLLFSSEHGIVATIFIVVFAIIPSLIILLSSNKIYNYLGPKGILAMEKLGGMIITLLAIEMLSTGIINLVWTNF